MTTPLDVKVNHFLTQKRTAVAGVSRDDRHHPVANPVLPGPRPARAYVPFIMTPAGVGF